MSIYNALLLQDGVTLRKLPGFRGAQDYRKLPVQTIMTHEVFTLRDAETPAAALKRIAAADQRFHAYPVLDDDGRLAGVITHHELEQHRDAAAISAIILGPGTAHRDARLLDPRRRQPDDRPQSPAGAGGRSARPGKLFGWLTLNDIARQQNAVEV